ncbi:MAG: hypothetical protein R3B67_02640 [Phycisphaerales bacterium]
MSDAQGPAPAFPEKRVRMCALCRFDLSGQEPYYITEYHLMAVRCPECGQQQPAGVIAQPWRFRRLKMACMRSFWLMMVIVALGGGIAGLVGMSQSTAYASTFPFAEDISNAFAQSDPEYRSYVTWDTNTVWYNPEIEVSSDWWDDVGREALLSDRGVFDGIDLIVLTDWLWFLLIAPVVAICVRIVFSQSHTVTMLAFAAVAAAVAALQTYLAVDFTYLPYYRNSPHALAIESVGMPIAWMTFGVGLLSYLVAYLISGRLVRLLERSMPALPRMTGHGRVGSRRAPEA